MAYVYIIMEYLDWDERMNDNAAATLDRNALFDLIDTHWPKGKKSYMDDAKDTLRWVLKHDDSDLCVQQKWNLHIAHAGLQLHVVKLS